MKFTKANLYDPKPEFKNILHEYKINETETLYLRVNTVFEINYFNPEITTQDIFEVNYGLYINKVNLRQVRDKIRYLAYYTSLKDTVKSYNNYVDEINFIKDKLPQVSVETKLKFGFFDFLTRVEEGLITLTDLEKTNEDVKEGIRLGLYKYSDNFEVLEEQHLKLIMLDFLIDKAEQRIEDGE